jgi:hypothetical protein
MRNIMQLVGGVVVAGAVAAGSTAFTAPVGMTDGIATDTFIGGNVTQNVIGGTLTALVFTADTTQAVTRVSAFTATFTDVPNTTAVTASAVGGTPGGSATGWECTAVSTNATTCTVVTAVNTPGGYYTGITGVNIKVG